MFFFFWREQTTHETTETTEVVGRGRHSAIRLSNAPRQYLPQG
jgi:hypothetical protein